MNNNVFELCESDESKLLIENRRVLVCVKNKNRGFSICLFDRQEMGKRGFIFKAIEMCKDKLTVVDAWKSIESNDFCRLIGSYFVIIEHGYGWTKDAGDFPVIVGDQTRNNDKFDDRFEYLMACTNIPSTLPSNGYYYNQ